MLKTFFLEYFVVLLKFIWVFFFFLPLLGILQLSTSLLAFAKEVLLARIQHMFTFQDITCFKSLVHQLPELLRLYPVSLVQRALLP